MSKWFDLGGFIGTVKDLEVSGQESGIWSLSSFYEVAKEPKNYEGNYPSPDYTITSFPTTGGGLESNGKDGLFAFDLTFTTSSQGMLMEAGATGRGVAFGISNGEFRGRMGVGSGNWGSITSNTSVLSADISSYADSACTIYVSLDHSTGDGKLWIQVGGHGSTNDIVLLDSDTQYSGSAGLYGGDGKGYGRVGSSVCDINTGGTNFHSNFNGTLTEIRYWADSTSFDVSNFGNNYTNS